MKNPLIPISIVTAILIFYNILEESGIALWLTYLIFILSPFLMVWMVIKVLKSDVTTDRTFDEYFYEDVDIRRSGRRME